jgi:hypothetical protein
MDPPGWSEHVNAMTHEQREALMELLARYEEDAPDEPAT